MLASVSGSITTFVGDHGVYAVFLLMAIDAVFPAASELVMVYAGALASGAFASQHVVLFGHADRLGLLGVRDDGARRHARLHRRLDRRLVRSAATAGRPFVERHGRLLHLGPERLARAERWFDRHDRWAVLLGRITPVVRSFVSIPAGVFRMPFWPYLLLTVHRLGRSGRSRFAGIGYAFGSNYERFHHAFDLALVAGAALLVLYLVVRRAHLDSRSRA